MIFVTGDTHGDFADRFSRFETLDFTKDDYIIICGDFGLIWAAGDLEKYAVIEEDKEVIRQMREKEKQNIDFLNNLPFTVLFVEGNHECHPRLNSFPIVDFKEGKAHKISDSIFHLMRGEMYNIYNKKIFTFGGARSHDIWNLLDPQTPDYKERKERLDEKWDFYREVGISWWPEEVANEDEFRHGYQTLKNNDWKCDYIISHEAPKSDAKALRRDGGVMCDYLEAIKRATDFNIWYYGHHHMNSSTGDKMQCLFYAIEEIGKKREADLFIAPHKKEPFSQRKLEQIIDKAKEECEKVLKEGWQKD